MSALSPKMVVLLGISISKTVCQSDTPNVSNFFQTENIFQETCIKPQRSIPSLLNTPFKSMCASEQVNEWCR